MKSFRTTTEQQVGSNVADIFERCSDSTEVKLETFPKYVRRQHLKRFLALYEIFKKVLHSKGSIVECGVFRGFGFMSWCKLSTILEPENLTRRIYGFDSFDGFPSIAPKDASTVAQPEKGELRASSKEELEALLVEYDNDRFLGHIDKGHLFGGDATKTIPKFVEEHPHLVVSLLFLDFDLYEPTKVAIETFLPRMPKGSIIAFDELDNPIWPGETLAILDTVGMNRLKLERIEWDPYISYAVID